MTVDLVTLLHQRGRVLARVVAALTDLPSSKRFGLAVDEQGPAAFDEWDTRLSVKRVNCELEYALDLIDNEEERPKSE